MQRHARTKFRKNKKSPLEFGMFGMMSTGRIGLKRHKKAHDKMGDSVENNKEKEEEKTKSKVETPVEEGPGKAPENKKEE